LVPKIVLSEHVSEKEKPSSVFASTCKVERREEKMHKSKQVKGRRPGVAAATPSAYHKAD